MQVGGPPRGALSLVCDTGVGWRWARGRIRFDTGR